ncbi:MAG: hypothetical protein K6B52_02415 [Clostridiales bacterium]|nr:hypothetical protein [Clostridiales bacterium]
MKNKRNLFVRIIAILMCALMLLGVFSLLLNVFAFESSAPATGSSRLPFWFIIAGAVAVVAVIVCLAVPKKSKKENEEK